MSNNQERETSVPPKTFRSGLGSLQRNFWCGVDRFFFPFWLIFQCALHGKRAVIIWRTAALGDIICTLPMCLEVRKLHPGKLLVFVTLHGYKPLVLLSRSVDAVYGVDHTYGKPSWIPSLSSLLFGLIAHFYEPRTTDERTNFKEGSHSHLVDDLSESCGFTPVDRQPRLYPSPLLIEETQVASGLEDDLAQGKLLIGINGGHTWPVREWDVAKWQTLIDKIHAEYDAVIIQFGINLGPGVFDPYNYLKGVRSLVNRLAQVDLVALVASCHIVISIDSGPVHVAGAVGTPVVGLFGAVNPLFRLPPSSPSTGLFSDVPCLFCQHQNPIGHWKTGCPYEIRCMTQLEVEPVFEAVKKMLAERLTR
jgi:ADP-heptose:LPS heptosyltransferase